MNSHDPLEKRFADDVQRIRQALQETPFADLSDQVIAKAWTSYSQSLHAVWLALPDDETQLRNNVLENLTPHVLADTHAVAWRTTIVDAGDGSGDALLELPPELLGRFGWKIGDVVTVTACENGCLFIGKPKIGKI